MWQAVRGVVRQWSQLKEATKRVEQMADAVASQQGSSRSATEATRAAAARVVSGSAGGVAEGQEEQQRTPRRGVLDRLRAARDHERTQVEFLREQSVELERQQEAELERAMRSVNDKLSAVQDEREAIMARVKSRADGIASSDDASVRNAFAKIDSRRLAESLESRGVDIDAVRSSLLRQMQPSDNGASSDEDLAKSREQFDVLMDAVREAASPSQRATLAKAIGTVAGGEGAADRIEALLDGRHSVSDVLSGNIAQPGSVNSTNSDARDSKRE